MSIKLWAEREVEIACKRENPDRKEGEWDYGCACYESALKAFNSLVEDGHSGMSINFTKQILNRLIDRKTLTPIEDTDDIWELVTSKVDEYAEYQCTRMSGLFKYIYSNGMVKYKDIHRVVCEDVNRPGVQYGFGLAGEVIDEIYPIKMPYAPLDKPIKVICEDFLTDKENGDFDTVGILYCIHPSEGKTEINKFFKLDDEIKEIDKSEYDERKEQALKLLEEVEE